MTFSFDQKIPFSVENNLSGKLRPSGRFSLVQIFRKKTKRVMGHEKSIPVPEIWRSADELDAAYKLMLQTKSVWVESEHPLEEKDSATLGLSDGAISPNRSSRGSKGINPRQKDLVCWAATCLEKVYTRDNLSFLTLTLPDLSPEHLEAVKLNWSDIVNRVQLRIKEKLHVQGINTAIVGCVELQLERFEATGIVYPHLHMVFRGRESSRSSWAFKPHQLRQIWRRCLSKFLPSGEYDWTASENVQRVKKSIGGYLAKYLSKSATKGNGESLLEWTPRDWILVSRRVRQLYESMSISGQHVSAMLSEVVRSWRSCYGYVGSVYISTPAYGERRIGYVGWLNGEMHYPEYSDIHPYVATV